MKKKLKGNERRLLTLGATVLSLPAAVAQDRPNILYIMCDDMGYGDLACYGQQYIRTPNIDRLAAEGMRFTDAYCGSPVSAPSRASLMTGQHTGHTHVRGNREYWEYNHTVRYGQNTDFAIAGQEPYDTAHVILPEIFKRNGYRTGMFGKWAGGYEGSPSTPDKRGVDDFFGFICQFQAHLYFPNFLNRYSPERGDTSVVRVVMGQNIEHAMYGPDYDRREQYSADIIHREALRWLDRQEKGKPFFGIFTYTLPHAELRQPQDSLLQAYRRQFDPAEGGAGEKVFRGQEPSRYNPTSHAHAEFAAMIARLDQQVGEIIAKLEERGLADNTVLIFTSDNGPHEEGGADPNFFNRPSSERIADLDLAMPSREEGKAVLNRDGLLKGLKRSTHEGGIRIPFIVRWPGRVEAGAVSHQPFAFYDLMPTFCDIAGISDYPAAYRNPRLENDWFDGISILPTLTGEGHQQQHDHLYWEFHETDMIGVRMGQWKLVVERGQCRLYDLSRDLHEDRDVAAEHPEIVSQMKTFIHQDHTPSALFPITLPD